MIGAILAAIAAHISYAVGDTIAVHANRKLGALRVLFWSQYVAVVIALGGLPFFAHQLNRITPASLWQTLVLAVLLLVSMLAFYRGLEKSNAVLAGVIAGAFPVLVVILSLISFDESLSGKQSAAITLVFLGMAFAALPLSRVLKRQLRLDQNLWYAFAAFVGWGIYFTYVRYPIETQGWFSTGIIVTVMHFVLMHLFFALSRRSAGHPTLALRNGYVGVFAATSLVVFGTYAFNFAIEFGQSSVVAPIAGSYPALYALLAYRVYRDRIESSQVVGVVLTLLGVVLLSLAST